MDNNFFLNFLLYPLLSSAGFYIARWNLINRFIISKKFSSDWQALILFLESDESFMSCISAPDGLIMTIILKTDSSMAITPINYLLDVTVQNPRLE